MSQARLSNERDDATTTILLPVADTTGELGQDTSQNATASVAEEQAISPVGIPESVKTLISYSSANVGNQENLSYDSSHHRRLLSCWQTSNCGSCLANPDNCAWCGDTHACLPLPYASSSPFASLFFPLSPSNSHPPPHGHFFCPSYDDRWAVCTSTFGCGVTSGMLLAIIISVAATLIALALLVVLIKGAVAALRSISWMFGGCFDCLCCCCGTGWRKRRHGWTVRGGDGKQQDSEGLVRMHMHPRSASTVRSFLRGLWPSSWWRQPDGLSLEPETVDEARRELLRR